MHDNESSSSFYGRMVPLTVYSIFSRKNLFQLSGLKPMKLPSNVIDQSCYSGSLHSCYNWIIGFDNLKLLCSFSSLYSILAFTCIWFLHFYNRKKIAGEMPLRSVLWFTLLIEKRSVKQFTCKFGILHEVCSQYLL